MIIVDSHCHLDMLTDYDEIPNIIARAQDAGVKYLQTICTRMDNFDNILTIAKQYENGCYAEVWFREASVGPGVPPK